MPTTDPREQLTITGNALLDVLYRMHKWDQQYPELRQALDQGAGYDDPRVQEFLNRPDFVDAFVSSMTLIADRQRLLHEYNLLRSTIEALEAPRPSMPDL